MTQDRKDKTPKEGASFKNASIKKVSEITGLPYTALRYYEDMGLIHTERSESSNYRVYSQLSMIEISDVAIYRSLNIPVEDVKKIMNSPIAESEKILDEAAENTVKTINQMMHSLNEIYHKKSKIAHYYRLKGEGNRIVDAVDIEPLGAFSYDRKEDMQRYLSNPYSRSFAIYIENLDDAENIQLGLEIDEQDSTAERLQWVAEEPAKYYKCVLRTEYSEGSFLELQETLDEIEGLGFEPISLLGKYIISDKDGEQWYDYYECWIRLQKA